MVNSNLAALPETTGGLTWEYPYTEDTTQHAERFYHEMDAAICVARDLNVDDALGSEMELAKSRVDALYGWKNSVAPQWVDLLISL